MSTMPVGIHQKQQHNSTKVTYMTVHMVMKYQLNQRLPIISIHCNIMNDVAFNKTKISYHTKESEILMTSKQYGGQSPGTSYN